MKIEEIFEASHPGRAWSGKLKRLDKLMAWMYGKDILNKGEKAKKDSIFSQYYRYYNDGDFPRALAKMGVSKYDDKETIQTALEQYLENFTKYILGKYFGKFDRMEFQYDSMLDRLTTIKGIVDDFNVNHLVSYWYKDLNPNKEGSAEILAEIDKLKEMNNELLDEISPVAKQAGISNNKIITFLRQEMKEAGVWDSSMEEKWKEMQKVMINISALVQNLITSIEQLKKLRVLDKE